MQVEQFLLKSAGGTAWPSEPAEEESERQVSAQGKGFH
jgi:hypothetical protein